MTSTLQGDATTAGPGSPSRLARGLFLAVPPVLGWLFARLVVTIASRSYSNVFDFRAFPWIRIDSFNYIAIARQGRNFQHCSLYWQFIGHAKWCGTAAWLPGYPEVIKIVSATTTLSAESSGMIASNAFVLCTLAIVWIGLLHKGPLTRSLLTLGLFAIFPGAVYGLAVFPISMASFGICAAIVALKADRPLLAGLALTVATAAYPSALYVVPVLMAVLCLGAPQGKRLLRSACGLIAFVPYVYLFIHDQLAFGHWNAYVMAQREAGPSVFPPRNPLTEIWHLVVTRNSLAQQLNGHSAAKWIAAQFLWATFLIAGATVVVVIRRRRDVASLATEWFPAILAAAVWTGLLLGGVTSAWYRGVAIAAPAALLARKLPTWAVAVLLGVTVVVTAGMSHYFFSRIGLYVK